MTKTAKKRHDSWYAAHGVVEPKTACGLPENKANVVAYTGPDANCEGCKRAIREARCICCNWPKVKFNCTPERCKKPHTTLNR